MICLVLIFAIQNVFSQTPGVIFQRSTASSPQVLEPNGTGYVSSSGSGFSNGQDMGNNSALTYRFFPQMASPRGPEPLSDLSTGAGGGHTDLANYPLAMYFDGANVMFRVRLGGTSTASKGYTFLFDTDGVFNKVKLANGTLIDYRTPSKVVNLGFEYEVVMASNFDILVYRHTGSGDDNDPYTSNVIWRGSVQGGGYTRYFQKAVAASTNGSNADYFYDFYVPLSAFSADGGPGIDPATPLRMSGGSVTSAQTGLEGTISDIGGVNDKFYGNNKQNIWKEVIAEFPPTSLNDLQNGDFCESVAPVAPVITTTPAIRTTTTAITGTSTENGSTIRLFRNGVEIIPSGTATISGNSWTFNLGPVVLAAGDIITATVYRVANGNCRAANSLASNSVTVASLQQGTCNLKAPVISGFAANQTSISGTTLYPGATIKIYRDGQYFGSVLSGTTASAGTYAWTYTGGASVSGQRVFKYASPGSNARDNNATITATVALSGGGCESRRSLPQYISANSNATTPFTSTSATPVITNTYICPATTLLYGTSEANALVYLFVKDQPVKTVTTNAVDLQASPANSAGSLDPVVTASAAGDWSVEIGQFGLQTGDTVTVKVMTPDAANYTSGYKGLSADATIGATTTTFLIVSATCPQTTTPVITSTTPCPSVNTISGTISGSEANGTVINVYRQAIPGTFAPATDQKLNSYTTAPAGAPTATWTATLLSGVNLNVDDRIYATAVAPGGKSVSGNSTAVTVSSPETAAARGLVLHSITEGATTITGTSNTAGTVNLYIEGQKIAEFTTVAAGTSVPWTVSITAANQANLAAGIPVTATITKASGTDCLECQQTVPVIVTCAAPDSKTVSGYDAAVCEGSTNTFTIASSQEGIIYTLKNGTTDRSSSKLGDGTALTLTSYPISSDETFTIEATKISAGSCGATSTAPVAVTANPAPNTALNVSGPEAVSSGATATITVENTQPGYIYQLREGTTDIGSSVTSPPGGGSLNFTTDVINSTRTFNVLATDPTRSTLCTAQLTATKTIGTNPLPVELMSFTGKVVGNGTLLEWATASERDNDYFEVERSLNGKDFTALGRVRGNNNSTVINRYNFTDGSQFGSTVYYRLKQVDSDGSFAYSHIVVIDRKASNLQSQVVVYPNPAAAHANLVVTSPATGNASVTVFDALGKIVQQKQVSLQTGQNDIPVETGMLANGLYLIHITGKTVQLQTKLQKISE